MADKNSGWACTQNVSIVAETEYDVTVRVICYWQNQGWRYDMNYVSAWVCKNGEHVCVKDNGSIDTTGDNQGAYEMGRHNFVVNKTTSAQSIPFCAKITSSSSYVSGTKWSGDKYVTIPAKRSFTISYDANGGSGAPGNQTKWYGTNISLSTARPSRTGYTFKCWNTNDSGTGTSIYPGDIYDGNANLTLYAVWTAIPYTVKYDANGGSGAPGNQTKTYGVTLKLSTTIPTRTNYNFLGWATSPSGGVVYESGANYTNNTDVTLYAVWELAYVKPRINNLVAERCTSNGTVSETGTYIKVTFKWATDKTVTAVKIQHKLQTTSSYTTTNVTASGTSSTTPVSQIIGGGNISIESSYHVRVYVSDGNGDKYTTYSTVISIGTTKFPIDVKAGGTGVAIGKVSEKDAFEVGMPTEFSEPVKFNGKEINVAQYRTNGTDHEDPNETQFPLILTQHENAPVSGVFFYIQTFFYSSKTSHRAQIAIGYNSNQRFGRYRYDGEWSKWYDLGNSGTILYDNTSGATGTINLAKSAANFRYLEIFYGKGSRRKSVKIHNPNGGYVTLDKDGYGDPWQSVVKVMYILNQTISVVDGEHGYINISHAGVHQFAQENAIVIYRVDGYM